MENNNDPINNGVGIDNNKRRFLRKLGLTGLIAGLGAYAVKEAGASSVVADQFFSENGELVAGAASSLDNQPVVFDGTTGKKIKSSGMYVDVRSYGAKCDGITDDSISIQAALDATNIAGGGHICIPIGTCVFGTTLQMYSNIDIIGIETDSETSTMNSGTYLKYTGSGIGISMAGCRKSQLKNFNLISPDGDGTIGIDMPTTTECTFDNVSVSRFQKGVALGHSGGYPNYYAYYNNFINFKVNGWHFGGSPGLWDTEIGINLIAEANDNRFIRCEVSQTNTIGLYIESGNNSTIDGGNFTNNQISIQFDSGQGLAIVGSPRFEWMFANKESPNQEHALVLGVNAKQITMPQSPYMIGYINGQQVVNGTDGFTGNNANSSFLTYLEDLSNPHSGRFELRGINKLLFNKSKQKVDVAIFIGTGLDNLTAGGVYNLEVDKYYKVKIDSIGTPDTFKWSNDGGVTWYATGVPITGLPQALNAEFPSGVIITFATTIGHTVDDYWAFWGRTTGFDFEWAIEPRSWTWMLPAIASKILALEIDSGSDTTISQISTYLWKYYSDLNILKGWNGSTDVVNHPTPRVTRGNFFITANTIPTTITDLHDIKIGQPITILVNDNNTTIQCSNANFKGNNEVDWLLKIGMRINCLFDGVYIWITQEGAGSAVGITPRVTTEASNATPTPAGDTTDIHTITALAVDATFATPTGTPVEGQKLIIRIKDNATARALSWNAIYRAGTDIPLPTTTVISKTLYCGFMYNSVDVKWDLLGVVGNI